MSASVDVLVDDNVCDDSGNILSVTTNKNDLTILAGHRSLKYENGTLKCTVCSTVCQEWNLNVHDQAGNYICDNNSIKIDLSSLGLSSVVSIKMAGKRFHMQVFVSAKGNTILAIKPFPLLIMLLRLLNFPFC